MKTTILTEDKYSIPFFDKTQISIVKGSGIYVYAEDGKKYIDLTSGWGVTSLGHASPVITEALIDQSQKIIQNPNSGLTYSPVRAKLLDLMQQILPSNLTKVFFTNSGSEGNDAAIKLARKISGKLNIISTLNSFHGRTISTVTATGQTIHQGKFKPLMPNHLYIPYNDIDALKDAINNDFLKNEVAAFIVEPIQGEGGVIVPDSEYLKKVSEICKENGIYLIVDEVQTGFYRTGGVFASKQEGVNIDFMTMAKGIASGFPFGAFAVSNEVAAKLEKGDHGGTYCGNPLGCSVAYAVIKHMLDTDIETNVNSVGGFTGKFLKDWQKQYPNLINDVRGKGLLWAIEFSQQGLVNEISELCLKNGMIINCKHGNLIRIFPALNITLEEMIVSLKILKQTFEDIINQDQMEIV